VVAEGPEAAFVGGARVKFAEPGREGLAAEGVEGVREELELAAA